MTLFPILPAAVNMQAIFTQLGQGFLVTLEIFALTLVLSLPLGLLVALGRMSKFAPLRWLVKLYISVMRGTPLMLQLMVVFFGPNLLFHIKISDGYRFWAVIIGFVVNYAAYFAEIYRGGIEAVAPGQHEAAQILGLTKAQTFVRIVLPQVFKNVLPSITNEVITLVKDTSLAFVLSIVEMFTAAKFLVAKQSSLVPFLIAGVFYYVMNLIVAAVMERIEKKLDYYK